MPHPYPPASENDALSAQQLRGLQIREYARKIGDREYDPDAALLRKFSPLFPRFTGHTVGQQSLEYALLLLFSDDRIYGTDDAGEANRILRKILEYQDLRPGSETYGNFFWMTHWTRVKDKNAVSFLCSKLVYAYLHFPDKLEPDTRSALERAFPAMIQGIRGHKVRWQYTNIFFLNLAALCALAQVLDDDGILAEAAADFDAWLEGTSADGFHEYNSPAYTPVTLFGLETAWAGARGALRERLKRALDLVAHQLALNLCPNGFLAGAASRAYPDNVLRDAHLAYAHVKFGTPLPPSPAHNVGLVTPTLFDYVPPAAVRELAIRKPGPAEIHDQCLSERNRRAHVMTPDFSLASQRLESVGGHSPPPYILLARHRARDRFAVPFLPDESFQHQPCAAFDCRQTGTRVVGRLYYDLGRWRTNLKDADKLDQRDKFLADPTYVCEPRLLIGFRDQLQGVRIGNVDWGGAPVRLQPGQSVAISYGDLFLGVIVRPLDRGRDAAPGRAWLAYGDDDRLRLHIRLFGGPGLTLQVEPLNALLFCEVKMPGPGEALADYADELAGWRLGWEGARDRAAFAARREDGATLAYPYSDEDPDPLGDALHRSPGLTLNPGDLAALVNGARAMPF